MRNFFIVLVFALAGTMGLLSFASTSAAPPSGFIAEDIITGLQEPDTLEFSPTGEMFIAERTTGRLRIATQQPDGEWSLAAQPFHIFNVPDPVRRSAGLRDIAFDPDYATNGQIYVFYMDGATLQNQVARITRSSTNQLQSDGVETVLFNMPFNDTEASGSHNGGGMVVGDDGLLYIATGDGWVGCCPGDPVQSLSSFTGKILRIETDGTIPADNPFVAQTTGDYQAIYALGLRNPFTMSKHPDSGTIYINDAVGANKAQIFVATAGANYGHEANGPITIGTAQAAWANVGQHGAELVTGGAWYPSSGPFPDQYHGAYFTALWGGNQSSSGHINYVQSEADTTVYNFDDSVGVIDSGGLPIKPVMTQIGPDGYLYYVLTTYITQDGTVVRVKPTDSTTVESPVFTPEQGNYTDPVQVSITTATQGAAIFYTLDGSDPTEQSIAYNAPFTVSDETTVRARAFSAGLAESQIIQATYTFNSGANNLPPVVDAGSDQTVTVGDTVILDGSATYDPDGDDDLLFGEQWTQLSGPQPMNIIDSTEEVASFFASTPGTYEFQLDVSDAFDTGSDAVIVVVEPAPAEPLQFNFQNGSGAGVDDWIRDEGEAYSSGAGYGWDADDGIKRQCGDRGINGNQLLDTLCHTQSRYVQQSDGKWQRINSPATWAADVANGQYLVEVSVGDAKTAVKDQYVQANGVALISDVDLAKNNFHSAAADVTVIDGQLELTFDGSMLTRINWVRITAQGPPPTPAVSDPVFSPTPGNYTAAISISISSDTPDAVIHYTLDGSTPDENSPVYSAPIAASTDQTVRAIAVRSDYDPSQVIDAAYTFNNTVPTVEAGADQTATVGDVVVLAGTASDADGDPLTYQWTQLSGPEPAQLGGPDALSPVFTPMATGVYVFELVAADAMDIVSDTVTITVDLPVAAAPVITPAAGNYTAPIEVTIDAEDQDATIYYTLDGSDPDLGSLVYTGPFTLAAATTVRAIVVSSGFSTSAFATADSSYTFNPNSAPVVTVDANWTTTVNTQLAVSAVATDVDGDPLTYAWTQTSGPSTAALQNADQPTVLFSATTAGVYDLQIVVSDDQATVIASTQILVQPALIDPLQFNFQNGSGAAVDGWTRDQGDAYSIGAGFGWDADDGIKRQCGDRGINNDQLLDTFCHAQSRYVQQPNGKWQRIDSPAIWSVDVPDGEYEVEVSVGDARASSRDQYVQANGVALISDVDLSKNNFHSATATVTVTDGQVTLSFDGSMLTKLNWVRISPVQP